MGVPQGIVGISLGVPTPTPPTGRGRETFIPLESHDILLGGPQVMPRTCAMPGSSCPPQCFRMTEDQLKMSLKPLDEGSRGKKDSAAGPSEHCSDLGEKSKIRQRKGLLGRGL